MASAMKPLYDQLRPLGYTRPFLKRYVLPEWWDDSAAKSPAALQQAQMILSRSLGLDFLRFVGGENVPSQEAAAKFRCTQKTSETDLSLMTAFCHQVASFVCAAYNRPATPKLSLKSALEVRNYILGQPKKSYVGFKSLVNTCWELGIPVIHLHRIPVKKKPDGLAIQTEHGPVIVILKKNPYPSWLLFILAHELGHVVLRHLAAGHEIIVDQKLSFSNDTTDPHEQQANEFAFEVIGGDKTLRYQNRRDHYLSAKVLAEACKRLSVEDKVEPGHIALNYAHTEDAWPVGMGALGIIYPNPVDPVEYINAKALKKIEFDLLTEETSDFLQRILEPA